MITLLSASVDEVLAVCTTVGEGLGGGAAAGTEPALRLLDDVDRAAVASKRQPADARRTLAGRAALRLLVAARTGAPARHTAEIVVDRTCFTCGEQHGRPRVDGLSLSSSSAGDRVLVAVAGAAVEVGVDVEIVPEELFEGFDDFALHPSERRSLPDGPGRAQGRIGSWVEKEAVLKAAGIGLTTPLEDLLVAAAPTGHVVPSSVEMIGAWEWRPVVQTASRQLLGLSVTALPSPEGYRCAIAAREPSRIRALPVGALDGATRGQTPGRSQESEQRLEQREGEHRASWSSLALPVKGAFDGDAMAQDRAR